MNGEDGDVGPAALPLLNNGKGTPSPVEPRRRPRRLLWAAAAMLLILIGGILGLSFEGQAFRVPFGKRGGEPPAGELQPSKEQVAAIIPDGVVALGRLRPEGDIVTVASPFGAADARVEQLLVAEGDMVAAGTLLAVLDSRNKYEAALSSAQNNLETRRAVLAQTITQVSSAQAETSANLKSARVASEAAEASLRRSRSLFDRGLIAQEALDAAESAAAAARGDAARLTATLTRYEDGPDGIQVDIAVAQADVVAAEAAVAQATRDLDLARVYAPRAGTILEVAAREGEKAPADGVLRMGDVEQMEAELEVFQSLAPCVQAGQSVSISSDVLGEAPLKGTVSRVGVLVGRQSITADDPAANTDARVVPVIVRLDGPSSARAASFVGLEVVARIEVRESEAMLARAR